MHPIHEQVHVRVPAVAVRYDYDLVILQAQSCNHPIGDSLHGDAIDLVAGIEAEAEMVDGLLDTDILRSGRAHDLAGELGIISRKVARCTPRYAFRFIA